MRIKKVKNKKGELPKIQPHQNNPLESTVVYAIIKPHTCDAANDSSLTSAVKTKEDINKKVREIISANPLSPFSIYKENLKKANIVLSDFVIKNQIHAIKKETYPKDDDFFAQISNCCVLFSNNEKQMFFRSRLTVYNSFSPKIRRKCDIFHGLSAKTTMNLQSGIYMPHSNRLHIAITKIPQ